jgi:hypothetical protein
MSVENLAILITPCIFRPSKEDIFKELIETRLLIKVSTLFLSDISLIFYNSNLISSEQWFILL